MTTQAEIRAMQPEAKEPSGPQELEKRRARLPGESWGAAGPCPRLLLDCSLQSWKAIDCRRLLLDCSLQSWADACS